jgi:hypothetical protein
LAAEMQAALSFKILNHLRESPKQTPTRSTP